MKRVRNGRDIRDKSGNFVEMRDSIIRNGV